MKRSELKQLIKKVIEEQAGTVISLEEVKDDMDIITSLMSKYKRAQIGEFDETGDEIYEHLMSATDIMMDFIIEGGEDDYEVAQFD